MRRCRLSTTSGPTHLSVWYSGLKLCRSSSNALDVTLRGRAGRWFSGQAQYTLGRSYNNTGAIKSYPQNQYDPNALEWGPSDLTASIASNSWALSTKGAGSLWAWAPPSIPELLIQNSQDRIGSVRGLEMHVQPESAETRCTPAEQRISTTLWKHEFKLDKKKSDDQRFIAPGISAFNILNHPNFTDYVGNIRSSLFRHPTTALPRRQIQFSLTFQF
jgi:hypothetical protein